MNNTELTRKMFEKGVYDATELRTKAAAGTVTDTEIIDKEDAVPMWDGTKDYTSCPAGSPFRYGDQVYGLLIPHNPSHYPGVTPANNRTLWSLKHTTNPYKAKEYVQSEGTSGLYAMGECCTDPLWEDPTAVHISKVNDNDRRPSEYPANWTVWEG